LFFPQPFLTEEIVMKKRIVETLDAIAIECARWFVPVCWIIMILAIGAIITVLRA